MMENNAVMDVLKNDWNNNCKQPNAKCLVGYCYKCGGDSEVNAIAFIQYFMKKLEIFKLKLLPCLHSFCMECLGQMIVTYPTTTMSSPVNYSNFLQCTVCGGVFRLVFDFMSYYFYF